MPKGTERPWILECWETDPDDCEEKWRVWSSTMAEDSGHRILDRLLSRGHTARLRNSVTGVISDAPTPAQACEHCDEVHAGPYDGSCLL